MPSPFPGMDPYLEAHWRDVHASLIIYARDALQGILPGSLRARVEERVLLEAPEGYRTHPLYPDVRIVQYPYTRGPETPGQTGVAVAEPLIVAAEAEPVTEPLLQIIDAASGNRIVTVVEFLSPANKTPGPNRDLYLRKQYEVCTSDANLVEIDLNRFGIHTLAVSMDVLARRARTRYMACVRKASDRGRVRVYPMPLSDRLPAIEIPLRPTDTDVPLDLQALVDQCYRNGAYEGTLNYTTEPDPPLVGAEKRWAAKLLREEGLRPRGKAPQRKGKSKSR